MPECGAPLHVLPVDGRGFPQYVHEDPAVPASGGVHQYGHAGIVGHAGIRLAEQQHPRDFIKIVLHGKAQGRAAVLTPGV